MVEVMGSHSNAVLTVCNKITFALHRRKHPPSHQCREFHPSPRKRFLEVKDRRLYRFAMLRKGMLLVSCRSTSAH
jgi:hypothetical protein